MKNQCRAGPSPASATVFLDIDDVICLSDPYGGYDVIDVVTDRSMGAEAIYKALFAAVPVAVLRHVHDAMGGRLRYVVSSTWREYFNRNQLSEVFRRSGLGFVAGNLHHARWSTPTDVPSGQRADEVAAWIRRHHAGEPFVIIDDEFSGVSLAPALTLTSHPFSGRVVLCQEGVGLTNELAQPIVAALRRPVEQRSSRADGDLALGLHRRVWQREHVRGSGVEQEWGA